jgi:hypothetical protein
MRRSIVLSLTLQLVFHGKSHFPICIASYKVAEASCCCQWYVDGSFVANFTHRDKTRVQMPAKMFPYLKLLCWLFMGPTLCFDTKQRNRFLIKFGAFLQ